MGRLDGTTPSAGSFGLENPVVVGVPGVIRRVRAGRSPARWLARLPRPVAAVRQNIKTFDVVTGQNGYITDDALDLGGTGQVLLL